MTKRMGVAVLIRRGGDDEISRALADGKESACRNRPMGQREREAVRDELARQRARERLDKMALHRGLTERDWAQKCFEAEMAYGEPLYYPTLSEKISSALVTALATITVIARGEATRNRRCRR